MVKVYKGNVYISSGDSYIYMDTVEPNLCDL